MFRKMFIFLLFCIASPAWLLMRSRYGGRFLRYLFLSWALMATLAFLLRSAALQSLGDAGAFTALDQWALAAGLIYPFSGLLWGLQAVFLLLHRLAVGTGDSALPHPWYTGAFPLFIGTPRLIDHFAVLGACFASWTFWYAPDGTFERSFAFTLIPIVAAFAVLAHSLRWNDNTLPYSIPEPKGPRREKQQVARVASKPRSQDALPAIFSRRDPALARITTGLPG
jgi:hypothetical protein